MKNPYKRLRELTRTSQKDFAAKHQLSKTTMIYIESGQYPDLSDYQIESLGRETVEHNIPAHAYLKDEYGVDDLQTAYHNWQSTERMQIAHEFHNVVPFEGTVMPALSPMHYFIKESAGSVQAFCKLLKVPAATVKRYEVGATRTMPKSIKNALLEVQYPYLPELEELQTKWTDR